jgi:hypothetical protein
MVYKGTVGKNPRLGVGNMSADVDNKVTFRGRTVSADDVAQVLGNTGSWLGRAVAQIRLSWNLGRWVTPKLLEQEISRQGPSEQSTVQKVCTAYYATRVGRSATIHTPQITKLLRNAGLPRWSFNRAPELVSLLSKIPGNQLVLEGSPRFWVRKNAHEGITIDPIDQRGVALQGGISLSKTGSRISENVQGKFQGKATDLRDGRVLLDNASPSLWMALDMARNVSTIIDIFNEKASLQNREIQYFHNGRQFFVRKNGDEIFFTEGDVNGQQIALILENGGKQCVLQGDHYVEVKSPEGVQVLSPMAGIIAAGLEKLKEEPSST